MGERGAVHTDFKIVFNKHWGGGRVGTAMTLRQYWSQGQKNRKEVTWAIHTCREKVDREGEKGVCSKVSSFHSCFSSWLSCKVSADMPGAWPGLDYNIKTTTDEAEWVKAKQRVVRYHLSCFHTKNNRCDNQYVLQASGWSGFPWKVPGSGGGEALTRPLFPGECLGQEAG